MLTRDEDKTRGKSLERNNALSLEATSQQDEDGARSDGGSDLRGVSDRDRTLGRDKILSRVVLASSDRLGNSVLVLEVKLLLDMKNTRVRRTLNQPHKERHSNGSSHHLSINISRGGI
jgi:hypothetical protein